MASIGRCPGTPLGTVDRPQLAVLVRPLVPDADVVLVQIGDVGITPQEPQQLVDDGAQMQFLGSDQREAFRQIETHLVTEHAQRAGAGPVLLAHAVITHVAHQLEVLLHGMKLSHIH